jgi:hypothetical protein
MPMKLSGKASAKVALQFEVLFLWNELFHTKVFYDV